MQREAIPLAKSVLVTATVVAVVWVGAGDLNPPPGAIAPTNRVQLNAQSIALPYTINQPGSYVLTSNLTGVAGQSGIIVASDNVTIDLNGFTLQGVAGSVDGVRASGGRKSFAIRNGTVAGWGARGLHLHSGVGSLSPAHVEGLIVRNNGTMGIAASASSVIRNCVATENGAEGIWVGNSSGLVHNCVARGNGGDGIFAADRTVVSNCTSSSNMGVGINNINGFGTIVGCTVDQNSSHGINAGSRSVIRECEVHQNLGDGIQVGSECYVLQNNCTSQGLGAGIRVTNSSNRIEANNVITNARGIDVDAGGNLIIRNSARANTATNYDIVAGNTVGPIVTAATIAGSSNPHANYDY